MVAVVLNNISLKMKLKLKIKLKNFKFIEKKRKIIVLN